MNPIEPIRPVKKLSFSVCGTPAPQGSKRGFVVKGRAVLTESSKAVRPWREAVKWAVRSLDSRPAITDLPVRLMVVFYLPRPKSVSKVKGALGPYRKPDLDKLLRSTLDALSDAGVWTDDARVVGIAAWKKYVGEDGTDAPGASVTLWYWTDEKGETR